MKPWRELLIRGPDPESTEPLPSLLFAAPGNFDSWESGEYPGPLPEGMGLDEAHDVDWTGFDRALARARVGAWDEEAERARFERLTEALTTGVQDMDRNDFERRMGLSWQEWNWEQVWEGMQARGIGVGELEAVIQVGLTGAPLPDRETEPLLGWPIILGEEDDVLYFEGGPLFRRANERDREWEWVRDLEFRNTPVVRIPD